jgi:hypothetical protein
MVVQLWNVKSSVNIVREIKCYLSNSKLIICEYNAFYFSEIAFIGFTLHEIKQGIVFGGTPGIYIYIYIKYIYNKYIYNKYIYNKYIYNKCDRRPCIYFD